jgi:NADPH-dependent 2,4-dienoyl-CoA reductase/sulfur reductase-like enzyme
VLLIDENSKPGGQLFKQIHKFFGSREHRAGTRGFEIGTDLLEETRELGIGVWLSTEVCGIYPDKQIWTVRDGQHNEIVRAKCIIIATGATENAISFKGWTLPGVMGAGAAQTMINISRVLPGRRVLMVGSGNVGLIVSYQLLQAGAEVRAVVEAAPIIGGYGVHSAKLRRAGVPFYLSHTVTEARGKARVESVVINELDREWRAIPGTEKEMNVDTICIATGLTPLSELAWIAGCRFDYVPALGGHMPWHNEQMQTSVPGVYIAGDTAGVEEASSAMEEGRLAGINAAASLGLYDDKSAQILNDEVWQRLNALRSGPFGEKRRLAKESFLNNGRRVEV